MVLLKNTKADSVFFSLKSARYPAMKNGGTDKFGSAVYSDYIANGILCFPAFTPAENTGYFFALLDK